ncbi:CHASE2 domain-containing protein [Thalassoporum mexicanum]|uniref:CHASE2 domain-containing protein n=1 Tax=Thalassoporum mexicanum TaxID=3457544 RepID=UPI0002D43EF4|nr:CHASE2 domain-containing protein [Pseudanabaena sp. PCC 7367]
MALLTALLAVVLVVVVRSIGLLQLWEWSMYDQFFRWKSDEPIEERIVIVGITEADIAWVDQYPIPDRLLAEALLKLEALEPNVIGLNLTRNVKVPPGHEELEAVFAQIDNLIGVERVIVQTDLDLAPPILRDRGQIGFSDVVLDGDGKIRRGLLAITPANQETQLSLGAYLAIAYLDSQGIEPQNLANGSIQFGNIVTTPFAAADGGYVRADAGGYQLLVNWRKPLPGIPKISLQDVIEGQVERSQIQDRIVLIGMNAARAGENYFTPFSPVSFNSQAPLDYVYGVDYHAQFASQLINAALSDRPIIRGCAAHWEYLQMYAWATAAALASLWLRSPLKIILIGLVLTTIVTVYNYVVFWQGLWLPLVPTILSILVAELLVMIYNYQRLWRLESLHRTLQQQVSIDYLTQIANRRQFDRYLDYCWQQLRSQQKPLSLIMCDIDFFKNYNDFYGHVKGDVCLQQVAKVLYETVKMHNIADFIYQDSDGTRKLANNLTGYRQMSQNALVARYGGEEFAIVLPGVEIDMARKIALQVRKQLYKQRLSHEGSMISDFVTMSYGAACMVPSRSIRPHIIVDLADNALYRAKQSGRDRVFVL